MQLIREIPKLKQKSSPYKIKPTTLTKLVYISLDLAKIATFSVVGARTQTWVSIDQGDVHLNFERD